MYKIICSNLIGVKFTEKEIKKINLMMHKGNYLYYRRKYKARIKKFSIEDGIPYIYIDNVNSNISEHTYESMKKHDFIFELYKFDDNLFGKRIIIKSAYNIDLGHIPNSYSYIFPLVDTGSFPNTANGLYDVNNKLYKNPLKLKSNNIEYDAYTILIDKYGDYYVIVKDDIYESKLNKYINLIYDKGIFKCFNEYKKSIS